MTRQRTGRVQDARRPRPRTTLEWYDHRDRDILSDLNRFRGRAIGRRLKELMIMGVEAERLGMRATEEGGVWVARLSGGAWAAGGGAPPGLQTEVADTTAGVTAELAGGAPVLDAAHQQGLDNLFETLDMG